MDQDTPLQPASQDRVNIQREPGLLVSARDDGHDRDSSVHDKINQFNSLAVQSKQLERKTADAALKRAMLGREEAETEMRRFRDEARVLRKQVEEGKERERRVGERLETVMENYGRAKETHAHTQSLWEKEIRRARKETFKLQSVLVKLQEELKAARMAQKSAEEALESERLRSQAREQEAFSARYDLVGIQGQLQEALERTKVAEHERDAFKTLAKSEEDIARIAAEGKLPLPPSRDKGEEEEFEEEFASPTKKKARVSSVTAADIKTSAWSEAELDELTRLWQWEKQRAARALDHVRYLETECEMRACPCTKHRPRSSSAGSKRKRSEPLELEDPADRAILGERGSLGAATSQDAGLDEVPACKEGIEQDAQKSVIFIPSEGVFQSPSTEHDGAQEAVRASRKGNPMELPTASDLGPDPRLYARTPSVDPPDFALLARERASLASLLEAPHQQEGPAVFNIPTTHGLEIAHNGATSVALAEDEVERRSREREEGELCTHAGLSDSRRRGEFEAPGAATASYNSRPHTVATCYHEKTTTTKVPLRDEDTDPSLAKRLLALQKTPSRSTEEPSFDINNPALTPTMTREEALAQIRERRGRARSVAHGTATPKTQIAQGIERRDVSAPAGRVANKVRP